MSVKFSVALRNAARGDKSYRHLRHRIFQSMLVDASARPVRLNKFLRDKLFKLRKGEWFALAFDEKDWRALARLREGRADILHDRYVALALEYIQANADRVATIYELNTKVSSAMLLDDGVKMTNLLDGIDQDDRQSLFVFRTVAAEFSYSGDKLKEYFQRHLKTEWLQQSFLYPLILHAINAPDDVGFDDFLSYVVSGEENDAEAATIKFLLRDDLISEGALGFKAYIALLCHPYDACEIFLNHIENAFTVNQTLTAELLGLLEAIDNIAPSYRSKALLSLIRKEIPFGLSASQASLERDFGFDPIVTSFLQRFGSVEANWTIADEDALPKPLAALARMRRLRYPIPADFDFLVARGRGWWFSVGGRLLNSAVTSLYMIPRRPPAYELRDLFRLSAFFGAVTPFLATSPHGANLLQSPESAVWAVSNSEIEDRTDQAVHQPSNYDDRMWIKAVQWELRRAERKLLVKQWLQIVRQEIRVAPGFLTGIDWTWVAEVIKKSRLKPFIGDPAGLYALLLLKIEGRERRSEALRTAAEPFVHGKSLDDFVGWLIDEFGKEAIAFARYLLDAEDILLLGLAPNATAALAARIAALEICVRRFRYSDLLPQSLFEQEWKSLSSALLLMSVNAGQFEIPWTIFVRDAAAKQHDLYTAAHSLDPSNTFGSILTEARVTTPYRYRNGKTVTYTFPNRLGPLISLVIGVIDDFLEHPAFGLEVLLSTRFRHDNMRREFAAVLEAVKENNIPTVLKSQQRQIIEEIEKPVLDPVEAWLDEFMHTNRPARPKGLFDIIPEQSEMLPLVEKLRPADGAETIIAQVSEWIRARLELQLPPACEEYHKNVTAAISAALERQSERLKDQCSYRTADVNKVIAAVRASLLRRADELREWFKGAAGEDRPPLTFREIKMAADGLFEAYEQSRSYRAYLGREHLSERAVQPEKVRLCFDLLREVFVSALEHTKPFKARVRITPWENGTASGFRFSNLNGGKTRESRLIEGHPYKSLDDAVFREGDSGLKKIASLAATIFERPLSIQVEEREGSFHLFVPLWPEGRQE